VFDSQGRWTYVYEQSLDTACTGFPARVFDVGVILNEFHPYSSLAVEYEVLETDLNEDFQTRHDTLGSAMTSISHPDVSSLAGISAPGYYMLE